MDAIVKWQAGELQGPLARLLLPLTIHVFIMEKLQSYNLPQVVAALCIFPLKTVLRVGDKNRRITHLSSCNYHANLTMLTGDTLQQAEAISGHTVHEHN